MRIYHGTTESVARKSIKEGLKPRICTGRSNWKHTIESNPTMVYLTSAYAPYFALNCIKEKDDNFGLIEIETDYLDLNSFFPDEDFIEQATRNDNYFGIQGKTMKQRTKWVRKNINLFQNFWLKSLEGIGNCSHKGIIPPKAITKVSIVNYKECAAMCSMAFDPSITILNYLICSQKYKSITKWFMKEKVNLEEFNSAFTKLFDLKEAEEYNKYWTKILDNQSGIEIIYQKS